MKKRISTLVISLFFSLLTTMVSAVELPKTGQTSCYDAYGSSISCASTGEDGDTLAGVSLPSPRFTDNSDGTVTDSLTGLMWTKNANLPAGTKTWQQALDYVAGMNAGTYSNYGYTDWRLPNIVEMRSLIFHENSNPALSASYPFTNVQSGASTYYHSSTTALPTTTNAWAIEVYYGHIGIASKAGARYVWPVRGGSGGVIALPKSGQTTSYATGDDGNLQAGVAWPASRFIDNGDSTVTDRLTGLMWTKNSAESSGTWQQALDYVAGMNSGSHANYNHTDWRLPTVVDLRSLLDVGRSAPMLPSGHPFTNMSGSYRWTATNYQSSTTKAWIVVPNAGYTASNAKSGSLVVWPARNVFAMKLPLSGGKNWLLTVQTGGSIFCSGGTDTYHTGSGYYSLDFDDYNSIDGQVTDSPIYSAASGIVDSYGYDSTGYGNWVIIDHQNGYKTRYAHMKNQTLTTSGAVSQGTQLGIVGTTPGSPYSSGTHLHFQVYYGGSSASTVPELGLVLMEGLTLSEYAVGCNTYYASTNTP